MTKIKLSLSVNIRKYLDFLLVYTLYTNHQNQKYNELIVIHSANFVKEAHFSFLVSS